MASTATADRDKLGSMAAEQVAPCPASRRLPPELVSAIVHHTADWELAQALGVRAHPQLPTPAPWQEFATPLDRAILRSARADSLVAVRYARAHGHAHFTQWGARVMLRFALVRTIDYLYRADPDHFHAQCDHLLPVVASAWGRRAVLDWANRAHFKLDPDPRIMAEAIDEASRHGQVESESATPSTPSTAAPRRALRSHADHPPSQCSTFGSTRVCRSVESRAVVPSLQPSGSC